MFQQFLKICFVLLVIISSSFYAAAYENQFADSGKSAKLRWRNAPIPISVSKSFLNDNPNIKPESEVLDAINKSFAVWEKAANVKFEISFTDKLSISSSGKSGDKTNLISIAQTPENLLLFAKDSQEVSARTRVFFNRRGIISEADIILNPYQQFSTDGSIGTYDLQAVLTHEIGHLLGLDHSNVIGATMQENQGKNGIYALPNFTARSLSPDDFAGIRGIYGANAETDDCCGSVSGSISAKNNFLNGNLQIWLEEISSGRTITSVAADSDGKFVIEGLNEGEYRIFSKGNSPINNKTSAAENLGIVKISNGKITEFSGKITGRKQNFNIDLIGFNGQLSNLSVPVNPGKSFTIYLGGKNIDWDKLTVGIDSPFIKVVPGSLVRHDYGSEISVVSLEILLDAKTAPGEYSIFAESGDKTRTYLIGGISVEEFENPWNNYSKF